MIASVLRAPVLTILFTETPKFSIVRTERGRRLPGGFTLRRRCVDDASARELPPGTEEIVAAAVDENGVILQEYAWPSQAVVFCDCPRGKELVGARSKRRASPRRIALPIRNRARYVLLYRAAVDGGVKRKVVGVIWLRRRPGDQAPKAAPPIAGFPALPTPVEVPFALRRLRLRPLREMYAFGEKDPAWRGGVEKVTSLDRKD